MIQQALNGMITLLMAKFIMNDLPHAAGLLANPGKTLTKDEFESLPIAYHGFDPTKPEVEFMHVTPDKSIAESHGKYLMVGRVPPGKLKPDPEIEGFAARRLSGIESFNLGSAIIPREYYWPDNYEVYLGEVRAKEPSPRRETLIQEGKKIAERLGNGVYCAGPWLPYGPEGKFMGHFFEDDAVTRTSFVAMNYEEAKEELINVREKFGAKPPVFDNPGAGVEGTCYEDAWRFLIKQDEGFLIHGSVQLTEEGKRINHAWVELTTGWVWEPQTKQYFTVEDFKMFAPAEDARYSAEEAAIMVAQAGKHGPWSTEERQEYLGR